MNKRNKLVIQEVFLVILFTVCIILIFFNSFWIFIELFIKGRYMLNLNNSNRHIVEEYLKQGDKDNLKQEIKNAKKIQYFLIFNDAEYTIYYKDGTEQKIYDDGLYSLKEYIEEKGFPVAYKNILLQLALIIGNISIYEKTKQIKEQIYIIDYKKWREEL